MLAKLYTTLKRAFHRKNGIQNPMPFLTKKHYQKAILFYEFLIFPTKCRKN